MCLTGAGNWAGFIVWSRHHCAWPGGILYRNVSEFLVIECVFSNTAESRVINPGSREDGNLDLHKRIARWFLRRYSNTQEANGFTLNSNKPPNGQPDIRQPPSAAAQPAPAGPTVAIAQTFHWRGPPFNFNVTRVFGPGKVVKTWAIWTVRTRNLRGP